VLQSYQGGLDQKGIWHGKATVTSKYLGYEEVSVCTFKHGVVHGKKQATYTWLPSRTGHASSQHRWSAHTSTGDPDSPMPVPDLRAQGKFWLHW